MHNHRCISTVLSFLELQKNPNCRYFLTGKSKQIYQSDTKKTLLFPVLSLVSSCLLGASLSQNQYINSLEQLTQVSSLYFTLTLLSTFSKCLQDDVISASLKRDIGSRFPNVTSSPSAFVSFFGTSNPKTMKLTRMQIKESLTTCIEIFCRVRLMANKKKETYRENSKRNKPKTCNI